MTSRAWSHSGRAITRMYVTAAAAVAIVAASIVGSPAVARAAGPVCAPTPANPVCNGDFSAGNSSFTSEYSYSPSGLGAEGTFAVASDPSSLNGAWPVMGDHTNGSGQMMVVNGPRPARVVGDSTRGARDHVSVFHLGGQSLRRPSGSAVERQWCARRRAVCNTNSDGYMGQLCRDVAVGYQHVAFAGIS
jgi:hypothetical protein